MSRLVLVEESGGLHFGFFDVGLLVVLELAADQERVVELVEVSLLALALSYLKHLAVALAIFKVADLK